MWLKIKWLEKIRPKTEFKFKTLWGKKCNSRHQFHRECQTFCLSDFQANDPNSFPKANNFKNATNFRHVFNYFEEHVSKPALTN